MTLKDIAKKLSTAVPTVPNLIQILSEGLDQATAGSTVEVTQVVSSGTKIATVTVDDESTDLYAPSALHNYSGTEHIVGKWIDNSDIYEKTLTIENVSLKAAGTDISIANYIDDFSHAISFEAVCYITSEETYTVLPNVTYGDLLNYGYSICIQGNKIIATRSGSELNVTLYITIKYIKAAE